MGYEPNELPLLHPAIGNSDGIQSIFSFPIGLQRYNLFLCKANKIEYFFVMNHKAGYVNILGKPNVGKSTLMNQLVGEKISIITSKAQTTRHRILGIVNGDDFQIIGRAHV